MISRSRVLLIVLVCSLMVACAPPRSVRVEPVDRPQPRSTAAGLYEVLRGDTLYGIAFRHGMDYRELASLNGIGPPYTIYPGQRLRLQGKPPRRSTQPGSAQTGVVAPIVSAPEPSSPPLSVPPAAPAPTASAGADQPVPVAGQTPAAGTVATVKPTPLPAGSPQWRWPVAGQVISRFLAGDPTRQGINLAGKSGDPVLAAADGVVVYSGAGLIGYGELIIVKHNDTWLSAYGHNRKRLVGEGDSVKGGQQVAELGRSGTSRDMLHFEVRRNGRPVDPLGVLPKR